MCRFRDRERYWLTVLTRLSVYAVLIDSIINSYLIQKTGYRPGYSDDASDAIGLVGSSYCDYFGACHYPGIVDCGLRVVKMGKSSLMYAKHHDVLLLSWEPPILIILPGTRWESSREAAMK